MRAPPPPNYSHLPPPPPRDSDFAPIGPRTDQINPNAKVSLILGSIGWLICGVGSIAGVYYGIKALAEIKSTGQGGRPLAIAGIVIGLITFVWGVTIIVGQVNS
ncbi:DUF4190 domain-containing protein [Mycobacterium numidiamassiliense]|uniref:DUF4190 domain-containing protein n=1 Tax=Mycobacterium numidiamassiliense TaxID=1841861 RepID=UPI00097D8C09